MPKLSIYFIFLTILYCPLLFGQSTIINGKITEQRTGSPIPFANVYLKGSSTGVTTDFDGEYSITLDITANDSLTASYIGYETKTKVIRPVKSQVINFQLEEDIVSLKDVVITAKKKYKKKENPAYPILKNTIKNKSVNDKRGLTAYEYEAYTKIELDIDNMSENFRDRKIVKKVTQVLDSIDRIAGEDGKPVLPFFILEAISNFYYKRDPTLRHEKVTKTKITGIGIEDGSLVSQLIGGTFQEYNFYQNWLNIVSKEFVSPISDGWSLYYDYSLIDSLYLDEHYCYRLDFAPKRSQDLAFFGTIWITKDEYAIKRIDVTVDKSANLNFIEKIKIQQDFIKTTSGAWLPEKTRVVADISQLTKKSVGLLAKFYTSIKNPLVNNPYPDAFYEISVVQADNLTADDDYWRIHRHDTLNSTEENVIKMIDTLRNIPIVKTATDLGKIAVTGYYPVGKFDLGSYTSFFGNNDIEGIRLGFGARTNIKFSRKMVLAGFIAYGEKDKRVKYQGSAEYIFNKFPWSSLKVTSKKDIEAIWLLGSGNDAPLLTTVSRFGNIIQPFLNTRNDIVYETQVIKGLTQKVGFVHKYFEPQFDFRFNQSMESNTVERSSFSTAEVFLETRFARDEVVFINDNSRLSAGTSRWPVFILRYTLGRKGVLGGDFDYHKFDLSITKKQKLGSFGVSDIGLKGGHVFNPLPYPLLYNTIGNESRIFTGAAYNLMNFFEFTSSSYAAIRYEHSFEGLILNRIPLINKLKWRLVGSMNAITGVLDEESEALTAIDAQNQTFETLNGDPYVEVGYGVKNVFKIFRVDAFHRLTQLDRPEVNTFTIKVGLSLSL